ncbi:uncharacterized protein LOC107633378 [Arachis ipaensis]|uniref:uncharacterized protein LOC107633378 n=1 Tax=Arachis ipaensis TaxID=130454 RepID=UPI0007AF493F|nr:uncharacterized protein LOC107633378 [Arachis ipaensis]XP_025640502.1 uncharacterized protein LOC112735149 [Arachis hypogaea]
MVTSWYGSVLLIAVAQDGNSNILPIAFAIVESESAESSLFFLTNLRRHITPQDRLLVISDISQAIKVALSCDDSGWHPSRAYHAYCIRHMAANFMTQFKLAGGKRYLINATYSPSKAGYEWYMDALRGVFPTMVDWAGRFKKEIWLQHCDSGRQFGYMTTNLSECINAVLKGTRYLPISAIVRITYERLQKLFVTKGREVQSQLAAGCRFSQRLLAAIEKNREGIPKMCVTNCDRRASMFLVEELEPFEGWGRFLLCSAIGGHTGRCFQAVQDGVFPIQNESMWAKWHGTRLCPNPVMRRKATGRPVSTRFRNDMDETERHEKRCGLCRQYGHTRRGCPNQPTGDV